MKIMFLCRALDYGGAENQLVLLARKLSERGIETGIAVYYSGGGLENELKDSSVAVFHLNKQGRWDLLRFCRELARVVSIEKPDILHPYLPDSNALSVLVRPFLPKLKIAWGIRASYMDFDQYDWLAKVLFAATCRLSGQADLIIANSHAGRSFHQRRGYSSEKMVVIPNGIDTSLFAPDPEAGARVRGEWNVLGNETLIGLVGRLDPIKDHPTFLKAAALLLGQRDDVRFVCVGGGKTPYREELKRMSENLRLGDRILFAGLRKDMRAVYNAFDIATLASIGEGFPNVVGEAMACGIPCVVTNAGDSERIVGTTGVVVPPGDPQALARGWQRILEMRKEEKSELGKQARDRIVASFGTEVFVARTEEALRSLL